MKNVLNKYLTHQQKRELGTVGKIMSPVFFVLAVSFYFHEFVVTAIKANVAINLGIIMAAVYGMILIMMRWHSAQQDFRVIERFGHEARAGTDMKTLLSQPWVNTRYVRHYLSHIANTGGKLSSQMDQNAIENELHALQTEFNNKLELPQFLVGFMVAMGLLGTFIGLLETLTGISGMLDGMSGGNGNVEDQFMTLVVELRKPLAGMGIAFSASMFGLVLSLVLAIMMINLRRYIGRVISLARNVMHDLIVITASTAPHPVAEVQTAGTSTNISGGISGSMLVGRFDFLGKRIEMMVDAINESTGSTQKLVDLLGFGPRMREISEKQLEELKGLSNKTNDQLRSQQALIEVNNEVVKASNELTENSQMMRETMDGVLLSVRNVASGGSEQQQILRQILETQANMVRGITDIMAATRQQQDFRDQLSVDLKNIVHIMGENKRLIQKTTEIETSMFQTVDQIFQVNKNGRGEFEGVVGRINDNLLKIDESTIGSAKHLWGIKESLNKLCNNISMVELIATGISSNTALLESLIEETRESNKAMKALAGQPAGHHIESQE